MRFIAQNFRERRIPADVIWLDIHYLEGFNPFTWDPERFPDPPGLIADLRQLGLRLVTIVDAHPKKAPGWAPYDSGLAGDHLVKNPDGSVYEAPVWPSRAEKNPGPSVFPDFSKPAAREWWGGLFAALVKAGVAGIWNDMNEPADLRHADGDDAPDRASRQRGTTDRSSRDSQRLRPADDTQATYEGLLRLRPNVRPFVLTRATYAGGQRYAAVWPGDNVSDWGTSARFDCHADGDGPLRSHVRGQRHRWIRRGAVRRAVHPLAADRRLLSVHAHAHRRSARPIRSPGRTASSTKALNRARHRAALRAAAAHLQRHARSQRDGRSGDAAAAARVPRRSEHLRHAGPVHVRLRPADRAGPA